MEGISRELLEKLSAKITVPEITKFLAVNHIVNRDDPASVSRYLEAFKSEFGERELEDRTQVLLNQRIPNVLKMIEEGEEETSDFDDYFSDEWSMFPEEGN